MSSTPSLGYRGSALWNSFSLTGSDRSISAAAGGGGDDVAASAAAAATAALFALPVAIVVAVAVVAVVEVRLFLLVGLRRILSATSG